MVHPQDNEEDIVITDNNLNVLELYEALNQAQRSTRAPSPETPEPASPAETEETVLPVDTRRNTMSLRDGVSNTVQEEPRPSSATLVDGAKKLKLKEPDEFKGERPKLREWLAQMKMYFTLMGWANYHDQEKITSTTSLLRGDAEIWITPYIENLKRPTWEKWPPFTEELNNQFGIIDKKGEARNRLKHITQGKRTMTEYYNEFRLASSEAELDDATKGEWLLIGMSATLQNAGGGESNPYEGMDTLARWAKGKETKLTKLRNLQKGQEMDHKTTTAPRNPIRTYRPVLTTQQGRDAIKIDATEREPNLNLSAQEFRW